MVSGRGLPSSRPLRGLAQGKLLVLIIFKSPTAQKRACRFMVPGRGLGSTRAPRSLTTGFSSSPYSHPILVV
jgi:hypothetical protein